MKFISNRKKRKGISLIWVVLTFLVVFGIVGLMLDWAHIFLVGHQLHNIADSAALAGSRWVADPDSSPAGYTARLKAQEYAAANNAAQLPVNLDSNGDTLTEINIDMSLPENNLLPLFNDGDIYIGRYIDHNRSFIKNDDNPTLMRICRTIVMITTPASSLNRISLHQVPILLVIIPAACRLSVPIPPSRLCPGTTIWTA